MNGFKRQKIKRFLSMNMAFLTLLIQLVTPLTNLTIVNAEENIQRVGITPVLAELGRTRLNGEICVIESRTYNGINFGDGIGCKPGDAFNGNCYHLDDGTQFFNLANFGVFNSKDTYDKLKNDYNLHGSSSPYINSSFGTTSSTRKISCNAPDYSDTYFNLKATTFLNYWATEFSVNSDTAIPAHCINPGKTANGTFNTVTVTCLGYVTNDYEVDNKKYHTITNYYEIYGEAQTQDVDQNAKGFLAISAYYVEEAPQLGSLFIDKGCSTDFNNKYITINGAYTTPNKVKVYSGDIDGDNTLPSLSGARYHVVGQDVDYDEYHTSNAHRSYIEITGLKEGTYKVYEESAPAGWQKHPDSITVKVIAGQTTQMFDKGENGNYAGIPEQLEYGSIKIVKNFNPLNATNNVVDKSTARFAISGPGITDEIEFNLNSNGEALIENLRSGKSYTIREISAPTGYILDSTSKNITATFGTPTVVEFNNNEQPHYIRIYKINSDTNAPLGGCTFELYKNAALTDLVTSVTTGDDGYTNCVKVGIGTYYWKETVVPDHYTAHEDAIRVDVTEDDVKTQNDSIVTTVSNTPKYSIKARKVDNFGNPLPNALIGIYSNETDARTAAALSNNSRTGKELYTLATEADGNTPVINVPKGTYYFAEIAAPSGYLKTDNVVSKTIDGSTPLNEVTIAAEFENKLNGYIKIAKSSANPECTDGNTLYSLEGAEFEVYQVKNGVKGEYITTLTTDASGNTSTINIADLDSNKLSPDNTYIIKETKAPKGYKLNSTEYIIKFMHQDNTYIKSEECSYTQTTADGIKTIVVNIKDTPIYDPFQLKLEKIDNQFPEGQGESSLDGAIYSVKYYPIITTENGSGYDVPSGEATRTWYFETKDGGVIDLITKTGHKGPEYYKSLDYVSSEYYYNDANNIVWPVGTYVTQEVEAPKDYLLSDDVFVTIVDVEQDGDSWKTILKGDEYLTPGQDATEEGRINMGEKIARFPLRFQKIDHDNNTYESQGNAILPTQFIVLNNSVKVEDDTPSDIIYDANHDDVYDVNTEKKASLYKSTYTDEQIFDLIKNTTDINNLVIDINNDGINDIIDVVTVDSTGYGELQGLVTGTYRVFEVPNDTYIPVAKDIKVTSESATLTPTVIDNEISRGGVTILKTNKSNNSSSDVLVGLDFNGNNYEYDLTGTRFTISSLNDKPIKIEDLTYNNGDDIITIEVSKDDTGNFSASTPNFYLPVGTYKVREVPGSNTMFEVNTEWSQTFSITSNGQMQTVDNNGNVLNCDETPVIKIGTLALDNSTSAHIAKYGLLKIDDTVRCIGLVPGEYYELRGSVKVVDSGEDLSVDGIEITKSVPFEATESIQDVTVPFDAFRTSDIEGKTVVVYEYLYYKDELKATHAEILDKNQSVSIGKVYTTAKALDGTQQGPSTGIATITDTVHYEGLNVNYEYTINGTLMYQDSNTPVLDADGYKITASTTFTPTEPNGTIDLVYNVDSSLVKGHAVVVFEDIYYNDILICSHADINDELQTIYFPDFHTLAADSKNHIYNIAVASTEYEITDNVYYNALQPTKQYKLTGTLYYEDGTPFMAYMNGDKTNKVHVTSNNIFTPDVKDGTTTVTFNFEVDDENELKNKSIVIYQSLYYLNDTGDEISDIHIMDDNDLTNQDETIHIPEIHTTAIDNTTKDHVGTVDTEAVIIDTVHYKNLAPGKEYKVIGTLMNKETNEIIKDKSNNPITSTKTFVATEKDGDVDVEFKFDSNIVAGKTVVVFEDLYCNDVKFATHADIEDEEQTIYYPSVKTIAINEDTEDHIGAVTDEEYITDIVKCDNLVVGETYTLKGKLYVVDPTNKNDTGSELKTDKGKVYEFSSKPFKATAPEDNPDANVVSMEEEVKFLRVNCKDLAGKNIVIFETLIHNDVNVCNHADINDKDQTIYLPTIKTTAIDGVDKDKIIDGTNHEQVIIDTVHYKNLVPGKEYTVKGKIAIKDSKKSDGTVDYVTDSKGNIVVGTTKFTPTKSDGDIDVKFTIDASKYLGETLVCFEDLFYNDAKLETHADLEDKNQTLTVSINLHVKIAKMDRANVQYFLKGAEITIYDVDPTGKETIAIDINGKKCVGKTNENGEVHFVVPYSKNHTYYALETKAPRGYKINKDKFEVKPITDKEYRESNNTCIIPIMILDDIIIIPPKTGDEFPLKPVIFGFAIATITATGAIYVLTKRKKKNDNIED